MLFRSRTVQQVATLPFVPIADRFSVLLITSRKGGRWLLPKGWPIKNQSLAEAAQREAEEEAGVIGICHGEPLGSFSYAKRMAEGYRVRCEVFVFPLLVREHCLDWPERGQRSLRWSGLREASQLVEDRGLARLLGDLARDDAALLRRAAAQIIALSDAPPVAAPG